MDSEKEQFIKFLKTKTENDTVHNYLQKFHSMISGSFKNEIENRYEQNELKQLIVQLSNNENIPVIVNRLDLLSDYIEDSFLHKNRRVAFFLEVMKDNIEKGILTDNKFIITDVYYMIDGGLSYKKALKIHLGLEDKYLPLLEKMQEDLSEKEQKRIKELETASEISKKGTHTMNLIEAHKIIENNLFKNKNLKQEDIEIIIESLYTMGINAKLSKEIRSYLEKEISKKEEPKTKKIILNFSKKEEPSKKLVNDSEYKEIRKEIKKCYVDIISKGLDNVSKEEIMYCAKLMLEIGTDEQEITNFLTYMNPVSENPITRYIEERDKLKYYEQKLGLSDSIKLMDEGFEELFITTNDDYVFWKNTINEELDKCLDKTKNHHSYELQKVRKFSPKNYKTH